MLLDWWRVGRKTRVRNITKGVVERKEERKRTCTEVGAVERKGIRVRPT